MNISDKWKKIIFIRKLKKGGSEHSFGIHVAKMAGIPNEIVRKASVILKKLESLRSDKSDIEDITQKDDMQLSFFQLDDPVLEQIRDDINELDINGLTPLEALTKLNEIKKILGK